MTTLTELFTVFFRIGLFTLGGGYAMVPMMEREVVATRKWVDASEFLSLMALVQAFPGPFALNFSTLVGYRRRGVVGALAAAVGIILPAVVCMGLLALVFTGVRDNETVRRVFWGLRPAVTALIAAAVVRMGAKAGLGRWGWAVAAAVALALWAYPSLALPVVVAAATVGTLLLYDDTPGAA